MLAGLVSLCLLVLGPAATAMATYTETSGPGPVHTWVNYHTAMGQEGPSVPDNSTIQITCRVEGLVVEDGNPWWYRIASSPWNNNYYGSADAFYNNGRTSGSLKGTPWVDTSVAICIPPAPAVATWGASSITQSSATLNGAVNPEGGNVTSCIFEYGTTPGYGAAVGCSTSPGSGNVQVGVSAGIGGLSPNTTYYYRLVAGNAGGTGYGAGQSFVTLPEPPSVVTLPASSVSQTTATLNATVSPNGGQVDECEFQYGTTPSLGSSVACEPAPGAGEEPVSVSAAIASLEPNRTYYYRVVAANQGGTSYGGEEALSTPPDPPAISLDPVSEVGQISATLNATVDPDEGNVSSCVFEYGTSESYESAAACTPEPGSGDAPVAVSASIGGLAPGTVYHYRVVATNSGGIAQTGDATFATAAPALPEVGRCLALPHATGRYKTGACTTLSSGENSGSFEWRPWPLTREGFTAGGGAAIIETTGKAKISCTASALSGGELTGSQAATTRLTLSGCSSAGALGGKCTSEGAAVGEIASVPLTAALGVTKAAKKPSVGWALSPASGEEVAAFTCGASSAQLTGSVIAAVTATDKMTATLTLKLKTSKGRQKPEELVGMSPQILTLQGTSGQEKAGLTSTLTVSEEEPVEIKVIA